MKDVLSGRNNLRLTSNVINRGHSHHNNYSEGIYIVLRTHRILRNECFRLDKNYFNVASPVQVQEILMTLSLGLRLL